jgi:phosphate:Na+ symporter
VIQSSSITTVLVVGMVNAGLYAVAGDRRDRGGNIGTTITGWVVTFSVDKYGLPLMGARSCSICLPNATYPISAMFVMGLGMVFYGLQLMKIGFSPSRICRFCAWFHRFEPHSYFGVLKCCMVGAILTAIVQSSSATLAITMTLAFSGAINYHTAAALVLGENIGTTITAFLASLGTSANARRAAYAHILFNVFGVMWITSIFFWYTDGIVWFVETFQHSEGPNVAVYTESGVTYPHVMAAIAATHTGFNVINTLLFLPMIGYVARFLNWAVRERTTSEEPRLTYLDVRLFDTPNIALEQSDAEVVKMGRTVIRMLNQLKEVFTTGNLEIDKIEPIFQTENDLDIVQKEVVEFIGHIMAGNITMIRCKRHENSFAWLTNLNQSAIILQRFKTSSQNEGHRSSAQSGSAPGILQLHDMVDRYINNVVKAIEVEDATFLSEAMIKGKRRYEIHERMSNPALIRVGDGKRQPLKSLIYTDMLSSYRRIKDHAFNIAEVLAGEK